MVSFQAGQIPEENFGGGVAHRENGIGGAGSRVDAEAHEYNFAIRDGELQEAGVLVGGSGRGRCCEE